MVGKKVADKGAVHQLVNVSIAKITRIVLLLVFNASLVIVLPIVADVRKQVARKGVIFVNRRVNAIDAPRTTH